MMVLWPMPMMAYGTESEEHPTDAGRFWPKFGIEEPDLPSISFTKRPTFRTKHLATYYYRAQKQGAVSIILRPLCCRGQQSHLLRGNSYDVVASCSRLRPRVCGTRTPYLSGRRATLS
jgi:hypothetical protein